MKKLIMAMAVVMAAALTQAASVNWSVSGLKHGSGDTLTSGAGYVFCTKFFRTNNPSIYMIISFLSFCLLRYIGLYFSAEGVGALCAANSEQWRK